MDPLYRGESWNSVGSVACPGSQELLSGIAGLGIPAAMASKPIASMPRCCAGLVPALCPWFPDLIPDRVPPWSRANPPSQGRHFVPQGCASPKDFEGHGGTFITLIKKRDSRWERAPPSLCWIQTSQETTTQSKSKGHFSSAEVCSRWVCDIFHFFSRYPQMF